MINSAELRISNFVWDDYSGWMIVTELRKESLYMRHPAHSVDGCFNYDKIEPIPLTPEILVEKCGFVWEVYYQGYHFDKYIIREDNDGFRILSSVNRTYQIRGNIKYLHQLQNLYFALTGQELEVFL